MFEFSTVGVDLAKNVIQVHGVDADGKAVLRRQLRRNQFLSFFEGRPGCLIGMEACSGAHHWGRRLQEMGHEVRLMPPSYVKPYVKRGKTDAADAEAICEAVTRPSMRFVPVKSEMDSAALVLHRARDFLVGQVECPHSSSLIALVKFFDCCLSVRRVHGSLRGRPRWIAACWRRMVGST